MAFSMTGCRWWRPHVSPGLVLTRMILTISVISTMMSSAEPVFASRHRPGPETVRGTVLRTFKGGFSFDSPSKGTFAVDLSKLTSFWEAGRRVKSSSVRVGTHIGVRGYLTGRTFRAIKVTVYKTKSGSSLKGTTIRHAIVQRVGANWILVRLDKRDYRFQVDNTTIVKERNLPVKLRSAKHGQLADVRYYQSGKKLVAIRITFLVVPIRHPKSHFEHGTVTRTFHGGFDLETVQGHVLTVKFAGHVTKKEQVSVRGYGEKGHFLALSVRRVKKLPVKTELIRGTIASTTKGSIKIKDANHFVSFELDGATKIQVGLHVKSSSALRIGQYVYIRFWWQGKIRVATTIHVYSSKSGHRKTGLIRGSIVTVGHAEVTVRLGDGKAQNIDIPSSAHIRLGSKAAHFSSLGRGDQVSLHYFVSGKNFVATSVHIFASGPKPHTITGTIITLRVPHLELLDGGKLRSVVLSKGTQISNSGGVSGRRLEIGQRVKVTGSVDSSGDIHASRVDLLPPTPHGSGSFSGFIDGLQSNRLKLHLTSGPTVVVEVSKKTEVTARKRGIPQGWLFKGASATVDVIPDKDGTPRARSIEFRPKAHTVTGDVIRQSGKAIEVVERSNQSVWCNLQVAAITSDGKKGKDSLGVGAHVKVDGFLLPRGWEAGLTILVSHPVVRLSGAVVSVHKSAVEIEKSSGQKVLLTFPAGVLAWSAKTHQHFHSSQIPIKSHLSVTAISQQGQALVKTANITLPSIVAAGVAIKLGSDTFQLEESTTKSVTVHVWKQTKFTVGRTVVQFSELEEGDVVSLHAYVDAQGGLLAHTVDIRRKLISRTGDIANLSSDSFDLVLKDGSGVHILVGSQTTVTENDLTIPYSSLTNGDHIHVEGHISPDGVIEATRIDLK